MDLQKIKDSKVAKWVIIGVAALILIYFAMSIYFVNHFYLGTEVNGVKASGKTVDEVESMISKEVDNYKLQINQRNDVTEEITASDIGMKYDSNGRIKEAKDNQNPLLWLFAPFKSKSTEMTDAITYDDTLLNNVINNLKAVNGEVVEPENASFNYSDGEFKIVDEVKGNKVNVQALHDAVSNAVLNGEDTLDLDSANCYVNPTYSASSKETTDAKAALDKCLSAKITYSDRGIDVTADASDIKDWLTVDENMNVSFNDEKMQDYLFTMARKFNTVYKTRDFKTTAGNTVQVVGGDYGYMVDTKAEMEKSKQLILAGETATKAPEYSQKAKSDDSNDIGNTYVEINLTTQHLWFYKDGALVVESNIVSGNVAGNTPTPAGTYTIKHKEKDSTLKGEDYNTPVSYWMPFNGGIGIHDAWWREPQEFVPATHLTAGSHGCINAPLDIAGQIFNNIESGTPVVLYE